MSASRYVTVKVAKILKETDKALLCLLVEDNREEWIPFSQIADYEDYDEGDADLEISVTAWIAEKKNLDFEA